MGIASYVELARSFENELGVQPTAKRSFAVTLNDDTLQGNATGHNLVLTTLGFTNFGSQHPDIANASFGLRKAIVTERFQDSPYHILLELEYGIVSPDDLLNPTERTALWSFETQPGQVPAFFYYDGSTRRPLVNSAYDYFEGLTVDEQMVRMTISKNYATVPGSLIAATNSINSDIYLGCPSHSIKIAGVKSNYTTEFYGNVAYPYWSTQSELLYRQSGWNLQLPDVGWNYIDAGSGQKRRAMVFDFENAEWVASPNPVALNGSGGQATGFPAILNSPDGLRVSTEANFLSLFGTPPS